MYESSRLVTRASIARSLSYSNFGDAKKRYDDKLKLKSWEEGSEEGLHVLSSGDQGGSCHKFTRCGGVYCAERSGSSSYKMRNGSSYLLITSRSQNTNVIQLFS